MKTYIHRGLVHMENKTEKSFLEECRYENSEHKFSVYYSVSDSAKQAYFVSYFRIFPLAKRN